MYNNIYIQHALEFFDMSQSGKTRIVVVHSGMIASLAAQALAKKSDVEVTVIDPAPKSYEVVKSTAPDLCCINSFHLDPFDSFHKRRGKGQRKRNRQDRWR